MTSRAGLWLLLAVVCCPLLFEATTGCQVFFPFDPPDDNALHCECTCKGTGSNQLEVVASPDDAEQNVDAMTLDETDLDLGTRLVGIRFASVGIPAGATITSAYVQFHASANNSATTELKIAGELSIGAPTFTTTDDDLSGRTVGAVEVDWPNVPSWANNDAGPEQQTPSLVALLQELVDQPGWSTQSSVVLRIAGVTGHRTAASYDNSPARAPVLVVTYDPSLNLTVPACASPGVARESNGRITDAALVTECARVETTLEGLAGACGFPTPCDCHVQDIPDQDDSFQSSVCNDSCTPVPVDAPACTNFDPIRFTHCVEDGGTVESCESHVTATNAPGDDPVCVPSGSALAFQAYGHRSRCDVSGTSEIHVGDREPKHDPATDGVVEILGGPCDGGGCLVHPFIDLRMAPITFAVKFHSDPTFSDLSATGRGLQTSTVDGSGLATFPVNGIAGTGNGRRGSQGAAVTAMNGSPLGLTVGWAAKTCSLTGNLVSEVDGETPDGHCDGDDGVACTADSPDCDDAGGPCVFPAQDPQQMTVDVNLLQGTLSNQPPVADAGPDQTIECTSPAGASFVLDGRGSSDPDQDLALFNWHGGTRTGPSVGNAPRVTQALGVGVAKTYVLRVFDGHAQTDEDETMAAVVDTTPPVIACNAPATLRPKDAPKSFQATATDVCDPHPVARVTGYDCFTFKKDKRISKLESCKVSFKNDTLTIKDSGGVDDHITWSVTARDASANTTPTVTCEVVIVK